MGKENNFVVETEGNCFLCSNPILTEHRPLAKHRPGISISKLESSLYSLQCLSRYLKMDMRKVFNRNQPIPRHLLKKVNDSKLMVLLCLECAKLNEEFSGVYGQLERIQMEVAALIKVIHGKLTSNCEHRLKLASSNVTVVDNVVGKRDIAKILRNEASHKCSQKLNEVLPMLKLQKLTTKQINVERRAFKTNTFNHSRMKSQLNSDSENFEDMKTEMDTLDMDDASGRNSGSGIDNSSFDDDEEKESFVPAKHEGSVKKNKKAKIENGKYYVNVVKTSSKSSKRLRKLGKQHATLDPKTGKSKCNICSKEFSQNRLAYAHYRAAHLNVRFKCGMCQKQFKYRVSYYGHVKTAHLGVTYSCDLCKKVFKYKITLDKHLRRVHEKEPVKGTVHSSTCKKGLAKSKGGLISPLENLMDVETDIDTLKVEQTGDSDHSSFDEDERKQSIIPSATEDRSPQPNEAVDADPIENSTNVVDAKSKSFQGFQGGKQHATYNPTTGKTKCNVCSKEYSSKQIAYAHYKAIHLNLRRKCEFCSKEFRYTKNYYNHVKTEHEGVMFTCEICKKQFQQRGHLNRHLRTCRMLHRDHDHTSSNERNESLAPSFDTDDQNLEQNQKLDEETTTSSKYFKTFGKEHATFNPTTGKSKCNVCSKEFSGKQVAYEHYKSAHLNVRYRCRMCQIEFTHKGGYYTHLRTYHLGTTFTCHLCSKSFKKKYLLTEHLQTCGGQEDEHTKNIGIGVGESNRGRALVKSKRELELPPGNLEVVDADKTIIKKRILLGKEHVTVDLTTGKSKCNACSKVYSNNKVAFNHYRAIHLNVRKKCSICDKSFKYWGSYYSHMAEHTGKVETFMCQLCGKTIKRKYDFDKHLQICGTKEPKKIACRCPTCGKGFSLNTSLHRHMQVHLEGKKYACIDCDRKFNYKSNLKSHRRKVHKK